MTTLNGCVMARSGSLHFMDVNEDVQPRRRPDTDRPETLADGLERRCDGPAVERQLRASFLVAEEPDLLADEQTGHIAGHGIDLERVAPYVEAGSAGACFERGHRRIVVLEQFADPAVVPDPDQRVVFAARHGVPSPHPGARVTFKV